MKKLFGTDGIRGIVNRELTAEIALSVGHALAAILSQSGENRPKVLIGADTRRSSEMLCSALSAGLFAAGADAVRLDTIPTPAVAYLVKKYGADAGVMISASHNPSEYNGIKIFGKDGFKLSDESEERIEAQMRGEIRLSASVLPDKTGQFLDTPPALDDYASFLLSCADTDFSGFKIGIDCANGAAYKTAAKVFPSLGAECFFIGDKPDGSNINLNCGSTDLLALGKLVKEKKLNMGFAFDGDADRCLAVDEHGNEVDGDFIMAILALDLKRRGKLRGNAAVGTVMTNLGFVKFCEENGIGFFTADVGDRYVLELMRSGGFSFGGEQSGHIILGDLSCAGDGQLTAIALMSAVKKSGKPLSALCSVMQKYPQYTVNVDAGRDEKSAFRSDDAIRRKIEEIGTRLSPNGRIISRPSGTEPYIRVTVECRDAQAAREYADEAADFIRSRLLRK